MTKGGTRQRIVEASDRLFHQRGFEHTSFADVAHALSISRGNFYHHFKTKDDILAAVIESRLVNTRKMLDRWEADGENPVDRILSFVRMLVANRREIMRYGCPVGTLCTELSKLRHPSRAGANELFELFRKWLRRQFTLLGRANDADVLAMHLLARSQGIATLANAFGDEDFIRREVDLLSDWLRSCAEQDGDRPSNATHALEPQRSMTNGEPRPCS